MPIQLSSTETLETLGQEMRRLVSELYPICRSITGDGVRETLGIIKRMIPLDVHEVPDGDRCLRLDGASGVEHPGRLYKGFTRSAHCRFRSV